MSRYALPLLLLSIGCTTPEGPLPEDGLTGKSLEWIANAQASLASGAYAEGLAWVDSAMTLIPNRPEPHFLKGRLHAELNAYDEAEVAYALAAEIDPSFPGLWINRGNVAFAQQRYQQALEAYRRESLREARVSHALGGAMEQMGKVDSALVEYREALALDPSYRPAAFSLARLLETLGRTDEALAEARRAAPSDDAPNDYLLLRARLEALAGNHGVAVQSLETLASREPWNYSVLFALGQAQQRAGNPSVATAILGRADSLRAVVSESEKLELAVRDAPSASAFARYGDSLRRLSRTAEAIDAYQRAVALAPQVASFQINLATLYLEAGRESEGLARLNALVERDPDEIEGWINLALFHGRRRDLARTRQSLNRAEAINPEHPMVIRLREALPE